jgi:hypothetical protein
MRVRTDSTSSANDCDGHLDRNVERLNEDMLILLQFRGVANEKVGELRVARVHRESNRLVMRESES